MAMVNQPVLNQELELFLEDKVTEFYKKIYKHPTAKPVNQEPNSERAERTETYLNKEGCKTRIIGAWINGNCSYLSAQRSVCV